VTVSTVQGYTTSVKNASNDRKRIIDQLLILQKVLDDVREVVEQADNNSVPLPTLSKLIEGPDGLPRYRDEMEKLKKKLEKPLGRLQALIWPLKEADVRRTLEYLKEFQQQLGSVLNTYQL
jgi:hypothetical protein